MNIDYISGDPLKSYESCRGRIFRANPWVQQLFATRKDRLQVHFFCCAVFAFIGLLARKGILPPGWWLFLFVPICVNTLYLIATELILGLEICLDRPARRLREDAYLLAVEIAKFNDKVRTASRTYQRRVPLELEIILHEESTAIERKLEAFNKALWTHINGSPGEQLEQARTAQAATPNAVPLYTGLHDPAILRRTI